MYTGAIPPASIFGTWIETLQILAADDGQPVDLSILSDIKVLLRDPRTQIYELTLTLLNGDITLPSLGIIQWTASVGVMGRLVPKLYELIVLLIDDDATVDMVIGSISIVD